MCSIFSPNFEDDYIQFSITIEEIANSIIETYDSSTAKIKALTNVNDTEAYTLDGSAIQLDNLIFEKIRASSKVLNYNVFHSSLIHLGTATYGDAHNSVRYFHNDGPFTEQFYPWGISGNQYPNSTQSIAVTCTSKGNTGLGDDDDKLYIKYDSNHIYTYIENDPTSAQIVHYGPQNRPAPTASSADINMASKDISFPYSNDKTVSFTAPTINEINISKCAITNIVRELIDSSTPLLSTTDGYITDLEDVKNLIKTQGMGVANTKLGGLAYSSEVWCNLSINYKF